MLIDRPVATAICVSVSPLSCTALRHSTISSRRFMDRTVPAQVQVCQPTHGRRPRTIVDFGQRFPIAILYRTRYSSRSSARESGRIPLTEGEVPPGERLRRAIFAAAALQGIKGSEPAVATATRVSRTSLRRLFKGGEPDGALLSKIASALQTTPEALVAAREGRTTGGLEQIAIEIKKLRVALVPDSANDGLSEAGAGAAMIAREGQAEEPATDPPSEPAASVRPCTPAGGTRTR